MFCFCYIPSMLPIGDHVLGSYHLGYHHRLMFAFGTLSMLAWLCLYSGRSWNEAASKVMEGICNAIQLPLSVVFGGSGARSTMRKCSSAEPSKRATRASI